MCLMQTKTNNTFIAFNYKSNSNKKTRWLVVKVWELIYALLGCINSSVSENLNTQVIKRTLNCNVRLPNFHTNSRNFGEFLQSSRCNVLSNWLQQIIRLPFYYYFYYAVGNNIKHSFISEMNKIVLKLINK